VVDFSIEPDADAGLALKLATHEWEVNVYGSVDDLSRLSEIRSTNWSERRSIQAGESAGARAYWASTGDQAALMIGHDDETWDVSVTVPYDVIDEVVREVRRYK
jgi:hypothetical protein